MRYAVALVTALALSLPVIAGAASSDSGVRGSVLFQKKHPAKVVVTAGTQHTLTDGKGRYALALAPGRYTLTAVYYYKKGKVIHTALRVATVTVKAHHWLSKKLVLNLVH